MSSREFRVSESERVAAAHAHAKWRGVTKLNVSIAAKRQQGMRSKLAQWVRHFDSIAKRREYEECSAMVRKRGGKLYGQFATLLFALNRFMRSRYASPRRKTARDSK